MLVQPAQAAIKITDILKISVSLLATTSHTSIYAQPRGELRKALTASQRMARAKRGLSPEEEQARGQLAQLLAIYVRPPSAQERLVPGHWTADLLYGVDQASVVSVLVEHHTRYLLLGKLPWPRATVAHLLPVFNGDSGLPVLLDDPKSPWLHGAGENTVWLLRQYLPADKSLARVSQSALDTIADSMNQRPRKPLGFAIPTEVFVPWLENGVPPAGMAELQCWI